MLGFQIAGLENPARLRIGATFPQLAGLIGALQALSGAAKEFSKLSKRSRSLHRKVG
jgi:hypothetical protein